ncbi:MAG TPA: hypothetical protein PKY01_18870 [Candidatus Hydrogenedentes bacterium]|nr:hypothetical protein [Candidatus Hydrogenedentota bacterium]
MPECQERGIPENVGMYWVDAASVVVSHWRAGPRGYPAHVRLV